MSDLIQATVDAVQRKLPDLSDAQLGSEYYYQSLPLCVIDAVFSIGVRYVNAQRAVAAWCKSQSPEWIKTRIAAQPRRTISDFVQVTDGLSGPEISDRYFGGNRQRTSSRSGILKAEAVLRVARCLKVSGIEDFPDIREPGKVSIARSAISNIPGQGSGTSFDYLLMMAGDDGYVKADRMICRFVAAAAGLPAVTPTEAQPAVVGACKALVEKFPALTPRLLDHVIWLYQRDL